MNKRKILTSIVCMILVAALLIPTNGVKVNATGPTLTTTLGDHAIVRNDRLTFDVCAKNQAGKKIASTVTLNGERVRSIWDDSDKTSYMLVFSKEGENTVVVSASSDGGKKKQLTYHITYKPAAKGEIIGNAVWSVEVFTLGCGYLIQPMSFPIRAGESSAQQLVRLLNENGFVGYYSGSVDSGFYLAYIADGTVSAGNYNGYKKSGTVKNPKKMGLNPSIPDYLHSHLESGMDFYDPSDYQKNWAGHLGEFVISNGAGWMYCVNNNFPNVGFSDMYLSDGDVVRVQFTLGYGADIGGAGALGGQIPGVTNQPKSGYYSVADKDTLTRTMAQALSSGLMERNNVKNAYATALSAATTLNSSQGTVDGAVRALENALKNPDNNPGVNDKAGNAGNTGSSGNAGKKGNSGTGSSDSAGKKGNGNTGSSGSAGKKGNSGTGGSGSSGKKGNGGTGSSGKKGNGGTGSSGNAGTPAGAGESGNMVDPGSTGNSGGANTSTDSAAQTSAGSSNETTDEASSKRQGHTGLTGNEADETKNELNPLAIAQGIIDWKKTDVGSNSDGYLLCDSYLELAGSTEGDWYTVGLSRFGMNDNYAGYLAVLRERIEERYRQPGRLSSAKATEWHRMALSILAAGGDPTAFGTDENGQPINLIADGTYNRGKTTPLGRQGINGWIWGLIALDAKQYEIPEDAFNTREDIIEEILSYQLADGGWALSGTVSDPDLTAMAVQALAPYYKDEKEYIYLKKNENVEVKATVHKSVDEALECLSAMQLSTGDFKSWGTQNVESTDQVIIALCCLGLDPLSDARFIKDGNNLLSGVLRYQQPDGGFAHSHDYDPHNPTSVPNCSNSMAGEQTLLAMAALWRCQNGMRTLYDFRPEENGETDGMVIFSDMDKQAVDSLPKKLTTGQYVTVTTLLDKLNRSQDFVEKEDYRQKLTAAKDRIEKIQEEIDSLNARIRERLYPFENISLYNKKEIDLIISRYNALSEYDRTKIEHWEDVVKAKTQVDNLLRALAIKIVLGIVAVLLAVVLVWRIQKKRGRKEKDMEELAARFADEDEE